MNKLITKNIIKMEEARITAYIGLWGSLILANTTTDNTLSDIMLVLAVISSLRYFYLKFWK